MSFLESRQESPTFMTGISAFHDGFLSVPPQCLTNRRPLVSDNVNLRTIR